MLKVPVADASRSYASLESVLPDSRVPREDITLELAATSAASTSEVSVVLEDSVSDELDDVLVDVSVVEEAMDVVVKLLAVAVTQDA